MGKIKLDLAAMFPQTFGDQDALRRAATAEQLQNAQLNAYTQNQQEKDVIRSNQVLPNEEFKIDLDGDMVPFKSLPREQKEEWARKREMNWQIQQQRNFTKAQADLAKAEVELETNLQKKADIRESQQGLMGGVKPGPDFLPGAIFGKPYKEQLSSIESTLGSKEQNRNIAGLRLQSIQGSEMPQSYGMPSVVRPSQQQPAVQAQPQAQGQAQPMTQPQGQQAVPTYKSRDAAIQGGAKAGDVVYIPGVGKVRMR